VDAVPKAIGHHIGRRRGLGGQLKGQAALPVLVARLQPQLADRLAHRLVVGENSLVFDV